MELLIVASPQLGTKWMPVRRKSNIAVSHLFFNDDHVFFFFVFCFIFFYFFNMYLPSFVSAARCDVM